MKKFFTELLEILSTLVLSSFIIYSLFKYIIGTPADIKSMSTKVGTIEHIVDTISKKQNSISNDIYQIGNTQIDVSQRLYDNNYLIKENNEEIKQLQKLIKTTKE
jgi:peptidoglycan hydrolase CwlO-like protein